jgi:hypothetical protein
MDHVGTPCSADERSAFADVDNGLHESVRRFLRQIVSDATFHEAMQIFA